MNTEIKAGDRFERKNSTCISEKDRVNTVIFSDDEIIVTKYGGKQRAAFVVKFFMDHFISIPEPKTRPITKDDIMKMLAVNPVLFYKSPSMPEWWVLQSLYEFMEELSGYGCSFSHNPFAPNPVIVGPEVTG